MLIRNYGLFWHRSDVFWGRQKNPGTLLGKPVNVVNVEPTDFREQIGVYGLFDDSFRLVYFGQAGRGAGRGRG